MGFIWFISNNKNITDFYFFFVFVCFVEIIGQLFCINILW